MTRILIVEDDAEHARRIERALDDMGIKHLHASSAEEAVQIARRNRIRLYLVDVELPGVSGFSFVQLVRDRTNAPVIFMGDLDDEAQKVYGFGIGADDYLVKPFGMLELSCRIRAILRRCEVRHWHADSELGLDRSEQTATVDGRKVRLTKLEFDLLYQLAMAGGRLDRQQGDAHTRGVGCRVHGEQQGAEGEDAQPAQEDRRRAHSVRLRRGLQARAMIMPHPVPIVAGKRPNIRTNQASRPLGRLPSS